MIGFFLLFLFFFCFSAVSIFSAHLSKAHVAQEKLQQTLSVFCTFVHPRNYCMYL